MRLTRFISIAILLIAALSSDAQAALRLAPTLTDGMVLQRNQPIVLWGTASAGQPVEAQLGNETARTAADGTGRWQLQLPARPASAEPISIRVRSGDSTFMVKDVLIGDVWFCAGQSNMVMTVGRSADQEAASSYAGNGQIRFLNLARSPFTKPITPSVYQNLVPTPENKAKFYKIDGWHRCDSGKLMSLSAIAYWFAQHVHRDQSVPIGLIVPPVGGSAVQAWVSRASIEADSELRPILDCWIDDEPERLRQQLDPWREANPGATFDQTPMHRHRPTTLYETAVAPMARHAIRGVLWYQGEQNAQNAIQQAWHEKSFAHVIGDFRANWRQPEMPFYYVQLPGFGSNEWPAFREQQRQFLRIPKTGMAVAIDLGDSKNIHPRDKRPIGERLALLALKHTYGKDIIAVGPSPSQVSKSDGGLMVTFGEVGKGL